MRRAVLLWLAVLLGGGLAAQAAAAPTAFSGLHNPQEVSSAPDACMPIGVEATDYLLDVTSTLPNYFGLPAKIDIHRVRPVYENERCSHQLGPRRTAILLHGRTVDVTVFDVQYGDYSLMRAMALAGIDSFAFNQLGYGLSSRFGMDDPCNVSNSHDVSLPDHPGNQQNAFLVPNPLTAECDHTDHSVFTTSQAAVDQLDQVIQHVQSTTGAAKVSLFSWSMGGTSVGDYLAQPDKQHNVANAVFYSSGPFGLPAEQPAPPYPTWPTGLGDYARFVGVFQIDPACPGQRDPNIIAPLWASIRARDPLGATWGSTDPATGGVFRWPTAIRWGWGPAEAARVRVPVMVISPLGDKIVPPSLQTSLYEALASERKVIVRIDCASHAAAWEGSTNASGWGGPHTTLQDATVEWMLHDTYQGATSGEFHAKVDGTVAPE
jgi:pimeloyl-ACP methyl ester carboxylesterase